MKKFEAAVVKSQAKEGRSDLHELGVVPLIEQSIGAAIKDDRTTNRTNKLTSSAMTMRAERP